MNGSAPEFGCIARFGHTAKLPASPSRCRPPRQHSLWHRPRAPAASKARLVLLCRATRRRHPQNVQCAGRSLDSSLPLESSMTTTRFNNPPPRSIMRQAFLRAGKKFSVNLYLGPSHCDDQPVFIRASEWCRSGRVAMRAAMTFLTEQYPPELTSGRIVTLIPVMMLY